MTPAWQGRGSSVESVAPRTARGGHTGKDKVGEHKEGKAFACVALGVVKDARSVTGGAPSQELIKSSRGRKCQPGANGRDKGTRVQITVLLPATVFLYLCLSTWCWPQGTGSRIKWTLPLRYTASPRSLFLLLFFPFLHITDHHAIWQSSARRATWNKI